MAIAELAATLRPQQTSVVQPTARLVSLDALRTLLVAMVIVHHVAQAYGPTGGQWPIFNPIRAPVLGPFLTVNVSFGLALLFLLAGYFVPASYDHKGARRFLKDRFLRLGVPLVAISFVLTCITWLSESPREPLRLFLADALRRPEMGHMWFVGHLLLYSCGYVVWRWLVPDEPIVVVHQETPPRHRAILAYTLGLAAAIFVVRIPFPVDRWVDPLPFVSIEPAHLPHYVSMFVIGTIAARRNWFVLLPTRVGMIWLAIGIAAALLPYIDTLLYESMAIDLGLASGGGLSLGALRWSIIEALLCVGLWLGLPILFRQRVHRQAALMRELAASSYAVYILHIFPVVGVQFALAPSPLPPLAKFAIATLLAVPLSFALAIALRRLPGARRVLP